ncbi:hypothetical protein RFI_21523 [Reticulomyxa filosa]|uniref:Uncharacterized protein n=1 Tax=Reticulomyxa filosa TaxID=46433 RepID=X6MRW5_RETFI|nr:hypothetical protein RFI_21523 [Reticulomyxa filosa]|eukprot:ETO15840.1 hypothetical protein RFI_21523 [Reticulomyxa filosa]
MYSLFIFFFMKKSPFNLQKKKIEATNGLELNSDKCQTLQVESHVQNDKTLAAEILIAKYLFVLASCAMYRLFLARIDITFNNTIYRYSKRWLIGIGITITTIFLLLTGFFIVEMIKISEVDGTGNGQIKAKTELFSTFFIVHICLGFVLIFLFVQKLYQVLKQSFETTIRERMHMSSALNSDAAAPSAQLQHIKPVKQMDSIDIPSLDTDDNTRKISVQFESKELGLIKTITKYSFLNCLCLLLKGIMEICVFVISVDSILPLFFLASLAIAIVLWCIYLQTSYGSHIYDQYCFRCQSIFQSCVATFSKNKIKSNVNPLR